MASVLAPYDSDQMIPAFGFGGQIPPHFNVSHCFPLELNDQKVEVHGVQVFQWHVHVGCIHESSNVARYIGPQRKHNIPYAAVMSAQPCS